MPTTPTPATDTSYQKCQHQLALQALEPNKLAALCALLLHRATLDLGAADTTATVSTSLQTYYTQITGSPW